MSQKTTPKPPSPVTEHRRRQRIRGLQRLEVQVRGEDAPLLRAIAAALTDPDRASDTRELLRQKFQSNAKVSFKALLSAAPLEGIEIVRSTETSRIVEL